MSPTSRFLLASCLVFGLAPLDATAHRKGGMGPRPGPPPRMGPAPMVPSHVPTPNVGKNPVSDRIRQNGRPDGEDESEPPTAANTDYGTDRGDFDEEGEEIFVSETGYDGPDGPVNRVDVRVIALPDGRRRRVTYGPDGSIASIFDMFPDGTGARVSFQGTGKVERITYVEAEYGRWTPYDDRNDYSTLPRMRETRTSHHGESGEIASWSRPPTNEPGETSQQASRARGPQSEEERIRSELTHAETVTMGFPGLDAEGYEERVEAARNVLRRSGGDLSPEVRDALTAFAAGDQNSAESRSAQAGAEPYQDWRVNAAIDHGETVLEVARTGIIVLAGATNPAAVPVLIAIDSATGTATQYGSEVGKVIADISFNGVPPETAVANAIAAQLDPVAIAKDKFKGKIFGALFPGRTGQNADGSLTLDGRTVNLESPSAVQAFAEAHGEDFAGGKLSDGMARALGAIAALPSGTSGTAQDPGPQPVPGRGGAAIP
ncbi:MAG: hypothetical protein HKP30_07110 [Myxococcales bacterium]|nr:hypothetical protein [Myxococcales bacterium]